MTSTLSNGSAKTDKKKKGTSSSSEESDKSASSHSDSNGAGAAAEKKKDKKEKKEKKEKKGRGKSPAASKKKMTDAESDKPTSATAAAAAATGKEQPPAGATASSAAVAGGSAAAAAAAADKKDGDGAASAAKPKPKAKAKPKRILPKDSMDYYNETVMKCGRNATKKMLKHCFKDEKGEPEVVRSEEPATSHIRHHWLMSIKQLTWGAADYAVQMSSTHIRPFHVLEATRTLMPGSKVAEGYTTRFPANPKSKEFMEKMIADCPLTRTAHHQYV